MVDNSVSGMPWSRMRGDKWRAYDQLPDLIRRALQDSTINWCPIQARRELRRRLRQGASIEVAVADELNAWTEAERHDCLCEQYRWPSRFGMHPATAAGATIMRYDEASKHA